MNNKAVRKERKKAPAVVTGVAEQFGDGNSGDGAVVAVTTKNFQELVLNEGRCCVCVVVVITITILPYKYLYHHNYSMYKTRRSRCTVNATC